MRSIKLFKLSLSLFLLILISSPFVSGALLGVNRASINFNDVLRGGYAEEQITVTIGQPNPVFVSFEARGDIADWIRLEPESQNFLVNENTPGIINVIIEPPSDARVDTYEGIVFISTGAIGEIESSMGTNVVVAFEVKISVTLTDTQILSCDAGGFALSDFEIGERGFFRADIRNTGNVRVRPSFDIMLYSQMQDALVGELSYVHDSEVIPTKRTRISGSLDFNLEPGQYWAEVYEPVCNSRSLITFNVLERGGISDSGDFSSLNIKTWASVNEIIPVVANFKNTGSRTVSAQFKGTVRLNGQIVEMLESDVFNVPPGELFEFESFFTPKNMGQYEIAGRIHYNNKVTFERRSVTNINEESKIEKSSDVDYSVLFLSVLVVVFALLVFLILRKKKKKRRF